MGLETTSKLSDSYQRKVYTDDAYIFVYTEENIALSPVPSQLVFTRVHAETKVEPEDEAKENTVKDNSLPMTTNYSVLMYDVFPRST